MAIKKRPPGSCSVMTPSSKCQHCGETYQTLRNHPRFPMFTSYPECSCGKTPDYYLIRKYTGSGTPLDFRYDSRGRKIRSLDDALRLSLEIEADIAAGTYTKKKYSQKKTVNISDNISDFLQKFIYPRQRQLHMTLDDKIWIEEWIEPVICDDGVFTLCDIHLNKVISQFRFKGEDKARTERLFNLIKQEIRL